MGVPKLWDILAPAVQTVKLRDLAGKIVAVDVSIWLIELQHIVRRAATATLPLKNVVNRCLTLQQEGITVLAVFDGYDSRFKFGRTISGAKSWYFALEKKVAGILECLGIHTVFASGEGEAACAWLQQNGYADYCMTRDADALLFGATKVIQNSSFDHENQRLYCTERIQATLNVDRSQLIFLASVLGSDFCAKIKGYGPSNALKLLNEAPQGVVDQL